MTDARLSYRMVPLARQPGLAALGLSVLAGALGLCYWLVPQPWLIALLGLAMLWQLSPALLPQAVSLEETLVRVRSAWRVRRMAWSEVRRMEPVRLGVWLYRDAKPGWSSKRKGLFLLIPDERRNEVLAHVRTHAQSLLG